MKIMLDPWNKLGLLVIAGIITTVVVVLAYQ